MTAVAELTDADLALWVARAIKYEVRQEAGKWTVFVPFDQCWRSLSEHGWRPDRDWSVGGPLVEQHEIGVGILQNIAPKDKTNFVNWHRCGWHARVLAGNDGGPKMHGETPLIAAMRALVASAYGYTVSDEVKP